MAPVTRSMTQFVRNEVILATIKQGLRNLKKVKGQRYKKQIVRTMYAYLCDIEPHLYRLFPEERMIKRFAVVIDQKIDHFQSETKDDEAFVNDMESYRRRLRAFIDWGNRSSVA